MILRCFAFTCLLLCRLVQASEVELSIEGLEGAVKNNVDVYLSAIPEKDYSTSLRFQSRLEEAISTALRAVGYYNPTITFDTNESQSQLMVNIVVGKPVLVEEADIVIVGEASEDEAFTQLIRNSKIKEGTVLSHGNYEALKSGIRNLALGRGYFDGDFTVTRLEVAPELNQSFVRLHYDSGIRYQFGKTTITGSQIEEPRVHSLIPYQQGEPYLSSEIGLLNQNLSSTGWFSSIYAAPDIEQIGRSRELPMLVRLAPESKNHLETGIGYSTDVGIRGTLKWKKPWVNRYGHRFDSSFQLSKPEQTITAGYDIPLVDVLNEYYRIQYGMKYLDNLDTESFESNLSFGRHWLLPSGWHQIYYVRAIKEYFTQASQEDNFFMLMPGMSWSKVRSRGGAMPMWGDKKSFTVEIADESLFSEARLLRLSAATTFIRSIDDDHRGIAKVSARANFTPDVTKIPPSLRYFAGGDNNLRGYGYESISPMDKNNRLIGAKYMLTSSLEYQYRLIGNWWLATFVDYGDAFTDAPDWKIGTGVGIRWGSPVGPIRLDFAYGLDAPEGDEFQLHFGLGAEL